MAVNKILEKPKPGSRCSNPIRQCVYCACVPVYYVSIAGTSYGEEYQGSLHTYPPHQGGGESLHKSASSSEGGAAAAAQDIRIAHNVQ